MKILILTQYFPPETGAPQNRLHSLASYLSEFGAEVSILTAMPNYPKMEIYEGYTGKFFKKETDGPLTVYRSWIYVKKSKGVLARLLNYFSFVFSSLFIGLFRVPRHDLIICESPPLFLGITALLLKWIKSSKLDFNVSDLWPESAEKLGIVNNKIMLGLSYKLESFIYKNANLVSGQTQGIITSINQRFPKVNTHLFRNGIDTKQFSTEGNRSGFRNKYGMLESDFVIAYAGIIGHAQGLEVIIHAAKELSAYPQIKFLIVGDGPEKPKLIELTAQLGLTHIIFVNNVPRSEMPDVVAACDCYVTPLRKNDLFLGAIPSKIFEPLSFGKPVLLGVDGEAKELFVDTGHCALHFEPENASHLAQQALKLFNNKTLLHELGANGRLYVRNNFDRQVLAKSLWQKLQTI